MKGISVKTAWSLILIVSGLSSFHSSFCQDSIPEKKILKNTVRFNLTNPIIFGDQCLIFGYERTIGKHQSFSVNVGRFSFPKLLDFDTDSIESLEKSTKSKGISLSADYRFYLPKLNKFNSPRGLYIGPYFSYNTFNRENELQANTASFTGKMDLEFTFHVLTVGFQLGYQFVFWNRVTLDMILFGPGISWYKFKADLSTNLDPDEESELFQKINDALEEKIPGYSLVIEPGSFEKNGSVNTTTLGYRYVVMVGIRF
jgi:hypothetical protein